MVTMAPQKTFLYWIQFFLEKYGINFLRGTFNTFWLALIGTIVGCIIGLGIGIIQKTPVDKKDSIGKRAAVTAGKWISAIYVAVFRFTPMMVQAMVIYYGCAEMLNWNMTAFTAGFIVISINTGAYMAETVRGGIESVDHGQTEGALAIGMTHFQTMYHVVIPQTIRNILPQIGNNLVINIKDTSVLNVISVTELFFTTKSIASTYYQYFPPFLIACVIYFFMCFITTELLRLLERKLDGPQNYVLAKEINAIVTERL
jgi:putative lysine transport system permease protein